MMKVWKIIKKNIYKDNEKSNIIIIINDRSINNDKNLLDKSINNDKNLLDKSISNYNVKNLLDLNKNGPLEIFLQTINILSDINIFLIFIFSLLLFYICDKPPLS